MTEEDASGRIGIWERVKREVRRHRAGYVIVGLFALAGPLLAEMVFPMAPTGAGLAGGLALGIYAGLCAVPEKFLDE